MHRLIMRLAAASLIMTGLLVTGSRFIGQMQPPAPTGIFLFEDGQSTGVTWVDSRTGAAYRRDYPGVLLDRNFLSISPACHMPVTWRIADKNKLAFLDLKNGRLREYPAGGELMFGGQPSPDGRYWWFQFWDTATSQLNRVILNTLTGEFVARPIVMGSYTFALWSPDARHVIEVIGEPPQGATDYRVSPGNIPAFLVNPVTGSTLALPPSVPGYHRWSPDGSLFTAVNEAGVLTVLDTSVIRQHQLAQFKQVSQLYWLPDSRHVLLLARNPLSAEDTTTPYQLAVWSLDDNQVELRPLEIPAARFAWVAPDLTHFYYDAVDAAPAVIDMQTGAVSMALPADDLAVRWLFWSDDGRYLMQLRQDDPNQAGYDGGVYLVDLLTQTLLPPVILPEYMRWQFNAALSEFAYFDASTARLGRLRPAETGISSTTIDQPGADFGVWCYANDAA